MNRYQVAALDVWGHSPDDCPDPEKCLARERCGFEVNDQWVVGTIEPSEDSDPAILDALTEAGYLTDHGRKIAEVSDYSDGSFLEINDRETGEPLFNLHLIEE